MANIISNPTAAQSITGYPLTLTGSAPLEATSVITAGLNSILFVDGIVYNGSPDLGSTLNTMIAALPTITVGMTSYSYGKITIPAGQYNLATPVLVTSPFVTIEGCGSSATQINVSTAVTGPAFEFTAYASSTNFFTVQQGGGLRGLSIIGPGSSSPSNAGGVLLQNIIAFDLFDVIVSDFWGTGGFGLWMNGTTSGSPPVTGFVERTQILKTHLNYNTTGLLITNNSAASGESFGYTKILNLVINVSGTGPDGIGTANAQTGISFVGGSNGLVFYNSLLNVSMNIIGGGAGNNPGTAISIDATTVVQNVFGSITAELTGTGSGIFANFASGATFDFVGVTVGSAPAGGVLANSNAATWQCRLNSGQNSMPYFQAFNPSTGAAQNKYSVAINSPMMDRTYQLPDVGSDGSFVIADSSANIFNVADLSANNFYIQQSLATSAGTAGFSSIDGPALQFWGTGTIGTGDLIQLNSGAENARFYDLGGVTIGAPPSGNKGSGTLNVANGIYLNGSSYTNPDYVLKVYYEGSSGKGDYKFQSLEEVEAYAKEHHQLPRVADKSELFSRVDALLEKVEELYLHMFELNKKVIALESRLLSEPPMQTRAS